MGDKHDRAREAKRKEWETQPAAGLRLRRFFSLLSGYRRTTSSGGTVAVATTLLLGPLGLLWGLKKGKAAIIPAGNRYTVFVQGDSTVKAQ